MLEKSIIHTINAPVNIIKVNKKRITCNIVRGVYKNEENEHTLHLFYPRVDLGFKIVETPTNVIYLTMNVQ